MLGCSRGKPDVVNDSVVNALQGPFAYNRRMISTLATWYIVLGGIGGGALFWACALDLPRSERRFVRVTVRGVNAAACALLVVGTVFLGADVGRLDRVLRLFFHPTASYIAIGAWALVIAILLALVLAALRGRQNRGFDIPDVIIRVLDAIGILVALFIAVYTGLLLRTMVGVALWRSLLIPALFAASSLSAGTAIVVTVSSVADPESPFSPPISRVLAADFAIVILEILLASALLAWTLTVDNSSMEATRALLFAFDNPVAMLWWAGFVGCGVALPLTLDVAAFMAAVRERARTPKPIRGANPLFTPPRRHTARTALVLVAAAAVLAGAFCLRFAVVDAGHQRNLEMTDAPATFPAATNSVEWSQ